LRVKKGGAGAAKSGSGVVHGETKKRPQKYPRGGGRGSCPKEGGGGPLVRKSFVVEKKKKTGEGESLRGKKKKKKKKKEGGKAFAQGGKGRSKGPTLVKSEGGGKGGK